MEREAVFRIVPITLLLGGCVVGGGISFSLFVAYKVQDGYHDQNEKQRGEDVAQEVRSVIVRDERG